MQNNAEIRATGGLPGAVSLLEADQGKVRLTRQMAGSAFPELKKPILPLTKEELSLYDRQLGTYFVDANFTPDFPRAAELWRARWERDLGDRIDGVLSLDPVTLSYLLEATGPIEAPGGVTLTAENAVDELLNKVYSRFPDPKAQDAWFGLVAKRIFEEVSTGVDDPQRLVQALARGAAEHRVAVHSFDDAEQGRLAGTAVAGELVTKGSSKTNRRGAAQGHSTYCWLWSAKEGTAQIRPRVAIHRGPFAIDSVQLLEFGLLSVLDLELPHDRDRDRDFLGRVAYEEACISKLTEVRVLFREEESVRPREFERHRTTSTVNSRQ